HRRVERLDRNLLRSAGNVSEHLRHPVRLEIEQPGPIGNDGELVLIGSDGNAVQRFLEQVDSRRRIKSEKVLVNRRGELSLHVVESDDDVDGLRFEPSGDGAEADHVEAKKAPGKGEIVAQEIEAAKQLVIVRD